MNELKRRRVGVLRPRSLRLLVVGLLGVVCVAPHAQQRTIRVGFLQQDGRYRVETMTLEDYVARVLAGEAAPNTPPAALEALAVTIRTYAIANAGRHQADGFDMCDQTHCQVVRRATDATTQAAGAMAGQILLYRGQPASVYYSASCGGRTEVPSGVWPGADDPPYLPSQPDDACGGEPLWTAELRDADVLRALRAFGLSGSRLVGLSVVTHDGSGRVSELVVNGLRPGRISGQDFRTAVSQTLGPNLIRSTAFDLRQVSGGYLVSGHGSGHGVGLCVLGSANLAASGARSADILARYFPGTTIGTIPRAEPTISSAAPTPTPPSPDVVVLVPSDEEAERTDLTSAADEARRQIASALGVAPPSPVRIQVHPTKQSFERATSRPWYGLSAVAGGEIHLAPLDTLVPRGLLVPALRFAMTRLLVDDELAGRPEWVREGLAVYYSRPDGVPAGARGGCPDDSELLRPVSPGALAIADGQAAACVARQLGSGRRWREIR